MILCDAQGGVIVMNSKPIVLSEEEIVEIAIKAIFPNKPDQRASILERGNIQEVPLIDLLSIASSEGKNGIYVVWCGDQKGYVVLNEKGFLQTAGMVHDPSCSPKESLVEMVSWDEGAYVLQTGADLRKLPKTFSESTDKTLLEVAKIVDGRL